MGRFDIELRAVPHLRRPEHRRLLARTGEFTGRAQKRYDDTVLILDAVLEHGPASCPVPHPREVIATSVHRSPERAG
jgi:hypothetical protein